MLHHTAMTPEAKLEFYNRVTAHLKEKVESYELKFRSIWDCWVGHMLRLTEAPFIVEHTTSRTWYGAVKISRCLSFTIKHQYEQALLRHGIPFTLLELRKISDAFEAEVRIDLGHTRACECMLRILNLNHDQL